MRGRLPGVLLGWAGVLLASTLPAVLWDSLSPEKTGVRLWMPASIRVQLGGLIVLLGVALVWPAARPMRLPLAMLLAFLVGWRVLTARLTGTAEWAEWQASQSIGLSLATSRLQWVPPMLLMTFVALAARLGRHQMFLIRGHWSAPVLPDPLFPFRGWTWFPRMFVLFACLGFIVSAAAWGFALRPSYEQADRVLVHLPGILAGSALNALCEEYIFRAALLPCLIPAVGARQAIALTAVLFGLEHWETAGPAVLLTCYGGWISAKSMVETGGWSWAAVQHFIGDVPIYAIVAVARP